MKWIRVIVGLGFVLGASLPAQPADPFAENIRTTPWQSPTDEQKSFRVPTGFEIQLVASEPDINKPMNLAFDALGRLWVTTTTEYPLPVPTNSAGRDRVMIFEDFGPDGRARKVTKFADGLNIPIGLYPFRSRNRNGKETWKAVVWSIPHVWLMEDTDGDGKADRRQVLYANFDTTRDTHGNQASFRRGFDGWLYCTHGYNNDSHVKGRDGHVVDMNSGNTYRIRLDGSRIEHYTHGQVNPFGLAFDSFGNLFASDCHSEPIYQLLADGYYPSFGKPHDGLGYVPKMMENKRGSTAIDGISIYNDDLWPEEFRGNIFIGDVMTSRVYRDRVVERGSTSVARAMPDLVSTSDPWFRPVDTLVGPDGALYIADFYNRIIGHYEVPLTHPGRDRTSGRIWRLVHKSTPTRASALPGDLSGLLAELGSPSLARRLLAQHEIEDRFGTNAITKLRDLAHGASQLSNKAEKARAQVHALWALLNLNQMDDTSLLGAFDEKEKLLRVHAARMVEEVGRRVGARLEGARPPQDRDAIIALLLLHLADPEAIVRRCAAEALGSFPSYENIKALLELVQHVPVEDTHMLYVARKALRDQLVPEENLRRLAKNPPAGPALELISELALSVRTPAAAAFLLNRLPVYGSRTNDNARTVEIIRHAALYSPEQDLQKIVSFAQSPIPDVSGRDLYVQLGNQFARFKAVDESLQQRGQPLPANIQSWGSNLVKRFFGSYQPSSSWIALPNSSNPTANPWGVETRQCEDGQRRRLISSYPYGDDLTGVLRSRPFALPRQLEFWLCGHDGFPGNPPAHLNHVRLREYPSGQVLAESVPARTDIARRALWDLTAHKGKLGYVEVTDGDDDNDYAWFAVGAFAPAIPELEAPEPAPREALDWLSAASQIALRVRLTEVAPLLGKYCVPQPGRTFDEPDADLIGAFAAAWIGLSPEEALPALSRSLQAGGGSVFYREHIATLLAAHNNSEAQNAVLTAMKGLPQKIQERLSYPLASATFSAETLLAGMESGAISARVLQRVGVNNRLRASRPREWEARVAALKAQFPAADDERDRLIAGLKAACLEGPGDSAQGRLVFAKNCSACHRLGNEGALIGPQLDGIGQRGLDRLCEDVLDPNRNVDRAFRTSLITLTDGDVMSGLFRREEGQVLVLADTTGKEITVPKSKIAERRESETSLMPENFGEAISRQDFVNLMAFLLSTAIQESAP